MKTKRISITDGSFPTRPFRKRRVSPSSFSRERSYKRHPRRRLVRGVARSVMDRRLFGEKGNLGESASTFATAASAPPTSASAPSSSSSARTLPAKPKRVCGRFHERAAAEMGDGEDPAAAPTLLSEEEAETVGVTGTGEASALPRAAHDQPHHSVKSESRHFGAGPGGGPVLPTRLRPTSSSPTPPSGQDDSAREDSADDEPVGATEQAVRGASCSAQARTCVACRKSKVKCSRGSPCDRCARLKLVCIPQTRGRGRPVASHKKAKLDDVSQGSSIAGRKPTSSFGTAGEAGSGTGTDLGGKIVGMSRTNSVHAPFVVSGNPRVSYPPNRGSQSVPTLAASVSTSNNCRRGDNSPFHSFPGDVAPHHSLMGTGPPFGYTDPVSSSDAYRHGSSLVSTGMGRIESCSSNGVGVGDSVGSGRGSVGGAGMIASHGQLTEQHGQMDAFDPTRFASVGSSGSSVQPAHHAQQVGGILPMSFLPPRSFGNQIHACGGGEYAIPGGPWQNGNVNGNVTVNGNGDGNGGGGSGGGVEGSISSVAARGTENNVQPNSSSTMAWEGIPPVAHMVDRVANCGGDGGGGAGGGTHEEGSGAPFDRNTMGSTSGGRARVAAGVIPLRDRQSSLPGGELRSMGGGAGSSDGSGGGGGGTARRNSSSMWMDSLVDGEQLPTTSANSNATVVAGDAATASASRNTPNGASTNDDLMMQKQGRPTHWEDDLQRGISPGGGVDSSGPSALRRSDSQQVSEDRVAARLQIDPTDTIVAGFWRLYNEKAVSRPKAVLVIRHWALCALDRRSKKLMHKTVEMAKALGINVSEVLNDYGIYAMFHDLLREAEAGAKVTPTPHVPRKHHVEASPYIQELSSVFAAVSIRVVLRGQSCFYHNDVCQTLFLSSEDANQMYAANEQDVWSTFVHPDDHEVFFDTVSMRLFGVPDPLSEFTRIFKFRDRSRRSFLALVHYRYEFQDGGNYAAFGLSVRPLPSSNYLLEPDSSENNGHAPPLPPSSTTFLSPPPVSFPPAQPPQASRPPQACEPTTSSSAAPPSHSSTGMVMTPSANGGLSPSCVLRTGGGSGGGFLPQLDFSAAAAAAVAAGTSGAPSSSCAGLAPAASLPRRAPSLPSLDLEMHRRVGSLHGGGGQGQGGATGAGVAGWMAYNSGRRASPASGLQQLRPFWAGEASDMGSSVGLGGGLESRGGGVSMASVPGLGGGGYMEVAGRDKGRPMRVFQGNGGAGGLKSKSRSSFTQTTPVLSPRGSGSSASTPNQKGMS